MKTSFYVGIGALALLAIGFEIQSRTHWSASVKTQQSTEVAGDHHVLVYHASGSVNIAK